MSMHDTSWPEMVNLLYNLFPRWGWGTLSPPKGLVCKPHKTMGLEISRQQSSRLACRARLKDCLGLVPTGGQRDKLYWCAFLAKVCPWPCFLYSGFPDPYWSWWVGTMVVHTTEMNSLCSLHLQAPQLCLHLRA